VTVEDMLLTPDQYQHIEEKIRNRWPGTPSIRRQGNRF